MSSAGWVRTIERAAAAAALLPLATAGVIGVVVVPEAASDCKTLAVALGWDGQLPMFRLSRRRSAKYATELREHGQAAAAVWIGTRKPGHVRVLMIGPSAAHMLRRAGDSWVEVTS